MNTVPALVERLENDYDFTCAGGPLKHCVEWRALLALIMPIAQAAPERRCDNDGFPCLVCAERELHADDCSVWLTRVALARPYGLYKPLEDGIASSLLAAVESAGRSTRGFTPAEGSQVTGSATKTSYPTLLEDTQAQLHAVRGESERRFQAIVQVTAQLRACQASQAEHS